MDDVKKILMFVISGAGAIYGLYNFYKEHEEEIKKIIQPVIDACKEVKDIKLLLEKNK